MTQAPPRQGVALIRRLLMLPLDEREKAIKRLSPERALAIARSERPWWLYGRPEQFAPVGDWRFWVINAGRGWGKTRTGAEWSADRGRRFPGCRFCLVAPTFTDGRDTMVEGDSGLLSVMSPTELRGGSIEDGWNRSMGELYLANGTRYKVFSSEQPFRLRGPQHHAGWGDEPSYWRDVERGTAKDTTFSNLNIGLRLPPRGVWREAHRPQAILTMTPRFVPLLKIPESVLATHPEQAGLLQRDDVIITTGTTAANLDNLDPSYLAAVVLPMIGTTLGLQELGGIMLEDVEGALWKQGQIDLDRLPLPSDDLLFRTVVALDPSGGGGAGHDEHGIIVASSSGRADWLEAYVRRDLSLNGDPSEACEVAIATAHQVDAHAIVYEKNQGQKWIPLALRSTYEQLREQGKIPREWRLPTLVAVDAMGSKATRARPVAALYQQHRIHHVGALPVLEGQMTTWVEGDSDSPDRLDALVWAIRYLFGVGPSQVDVASTARRERGGRTAAMPSSRLPSVYGARPRRG